MFYFQVIPYLLQFKQTKQTASSTLKTKKSWFIKLYHSKFPLYYGLGECSILPHLNTNIQLFETSLYELRSKRLVEISKDTLTLWDNTPPLRFAIESAFLDWKNKGKRILFSTPFIKEEEGIPTNALIWIDTIENQKKEIERIVNQGFHCIKIKVGQHPLQDDIDLIQWIRDTFPSNLEIRLDANASFSPNDAKKFLQKIATYQIHSIEQPIAINQRQHMQELCAFSSVNVALDEELLSKMNLEKKEKLLSEIKPKYIILKPTLLGGFQQSQEWIDIAQQYNVKYWVTSSLESNIALNAIAQWVVYKQLHKESNQTIYQGLSTTSLFLNNIYTGFYFKKEILYQQKNHYFTFG